MVSGTQSKAPATIRRERIFLVFAAERFQGRVIQSIRRRDIEALIDECPAGGKMPSTANMLLRHLKAVFKGGIWKHDTSLFRHGNTLAQRGLHGSYRRLVCDSESTLFT